MNRANNFKAFCFRLLAGMLSLVMLSCQDEPLPERNEEIGQGVGQPVRFEVSPIASDVTTGTRGPAISGTEFPDGRSFGVLGYRLETEGWQNNLLPNFMYNKKVTRNGNTYSYDSTEYWPAARIRFFAYHPFATSTNGISISPATQPGAPVVGFRVKPVVTEQVDLLLSATAPVLAPDYVALPFRHGLTRVTFLVRKNETNREVKVTSLTLKNIIGAGTVSLAPNNDGRFNWTLSSSFEDITEYTVAIPDANGREGGLVPPEQQQINSTDFQNISSPNGTLFLIPQQITAGRSLLIVRYTIDGQKEQQEVLLPATSRGSANEWLSGKYIQFQVTIHTDNTLEEVTISTAQANANCIMLNPVPKINPVADFVEYSIPILQVNRFYDNPAFNQWNGNVEGIGSTDAWGIRVIWMDQANLLSITKNKGRGANDNPDGRFSIKVSSHSVGNALLGIYKDKNENDQQDNDEPWLWSWHLWLTDYEPDKRTAGSLTVNSTEGEWEVPNGKIHRYRNGILTLSNTNNGDYGSLDVWTPTTGLYAGLAIMDRNIGSVSAAFTPLENNIPFESAGLNERKAPLHVLYYQYGRKDPFLSNAYRYREDGTALNTVEMYNEQMSILHSIQNPEKYVHGRQSWASDKPTNCYWYDPRHSASISLSDDTGKKSIFDPCPAGWRLPVNGTWSDFSNQTFPWVDADRGRVYTPVGNSNLKVYYPANGYRNASEGIVQQTGYHGVYWSCSLIPNNDRDFCFRFSTGEKNILEGTVFPDIVHPSAQVYQTDSFSVRCVQDRENGTSVSDKSQKG